jgi:DNA mismatch repair protein MutS2
VRLGDVVYLPALQAEGQVAALTATEAEVQVGRLRVRAKLGELVVSGQVADRRPPAVDDPRSAAPASPGLELDLRGNTIEEAMPELERYLDSAYLAGLPWVRIIHGKGTGKLRQAVREALRQSPLVKSHKAGEDGEGGEGVTVARLAVAD